jgi:hypothetical protein
VSRVRGRGQEEKGETERERMENHEKKKEKKQKEENLARRMELIHKILSTRREEKTENFYQHSSSGGLSVPARTPSAIKCGKLPFGCWAFVCGGGRRSVAEKTN